MTPTSGAEPASGARPWIAAGAVTSCHCAPARTRAVRLAGSMRTPRIRLVLIRIVRSSGPLAAAPWPVACGVTGSPCARAWSTIALTSASVCGNATAAGRWSTARFHGRRTSSYSASAGPNTSPCRRARRAATSVWGRSVISMSRWSPARCAGASGVPLVQGYGLHPADALRRPVGDDGLADDPLAGHRAPEARVVGVAAVVAHQEVRALRDGDRLEVALGARAAGGERLARLLAVADHVTVDDRDLVPGHAHDALDERRVRLLRGRLRARVAGLRAAAVERALTVDAALAGHRALRRGEDGHVPQLRVPADLVAEAIDEDPLAGLQRRHHRLRRGPGRLYPQRPGSERGEKRPPRRPHAHH